MSTPSKDTAKFVFVGTVRRTKAATLAGLTSKERERTVVVRVDDIVRGPEALLGYAGQEITVQLAKGERVKTGQQAVFYTNGWLFGESMAVKSVGHEPLRAPEAAAAARAVADAVPADPALEAARQQVRQRVDDAQLVISGRVVAVGETAESAARATAATAAADSAPTASRPISEHDPFWNEAVVEVQNVHKGAAAGQRVVIRFPASTDVRWRRSPKFRVGQEGLFMLHPDQVTGLPAVGAVADALAPAGSFTCLDALDFQPADHQQEIETVLATTAAAPP